MTSVLDNAWVQNIASEVLGVGLGLLAGYLIGRRLERRKLVKKFYDGITPVLQSIAERRRAGAITPAIARALVQAASAGFRDAFLEDPSWLVLKKERLYPPGTDMDCGVCGQEVTLSQDLCPHCSLDCCVWVSLNSRVRVTGRGATS